MVMHAVVSLPYLQHKAGGDILETYVGEAKKHAEIWFDTIRAIAAQRKVPTTSEVILEVESIADVIVNYAKTNNVDLIVIPSRGRTGLRRFLLGSIASRVVSHAHCPVLVVR